MHVRFTGARRGLMRCPCPGNYQRSPAGSLASFVSRIVRWRHAPDRVTGCAEAMEGGPGGGECNTAQSPSRLVIADGLAEQWLADSGGGR